MVHFVIDDSVDAKSGDLQESTAKKDQVDFVADQAGIFDTQYTPVGEDREVGEGESGACRKHERDRKGTGKALHHLESYGSRRFRANTKGEPEWRFGCEQPCALKDAPTLISLFLSVLGFVGGSFRARNQSRLIAPCCQPERIG